MADGVDAGGAVQAAKMLDSGSNLFVFAADASDPNDILAGGALGENAAIFRLGAR